MKISITNGNQEGIELEVIQDGVVLKKLFKQYQSLFSLYNLIKLWYSDRKIIKPIEPVGLFAPSVSDCILKNQEFLNKILKELGADSFPIKSFLRLYNLSDKVVIITGASSGIGKANAYQLAKMGAKLILACRSESKTLPVIEDIKKKTGNENIEFMELDLLDLDSVRAFIVSFKEKNLPLHILINNAGSVALEGKTPYGIDKTFGVNHVGPVVLTMGLLDIITNTENSRIIFVSSSLAEKTKKLPFDKIRAGIPLNFLYPVEAYGYSKLANVLFTKLLAKKLSDSGKSTKIFALHPGDVATDIYRSMPNSVASVVKKFLLQEEEGSFMTLYLAVDPGCDQFSGNYFSYPKGFTPLSVPLFEEDELQRLCWEETSKMSVIDRGQIQIQKGTNIELADFIS